MSGFMDEHERTRQPLVTTRWKSPRAPVHGVSLHDEGAEVAPKGEPLKVESVPNLDYWRKFVGRYVWIEWASAPDDWRGYRVNDLWSRDGRLFGITVESMSYRDPVKGWQEDIAGGVSPVAFADIKSIRLLTDEEKRPPVRDSRFAIRDSRITNDGHLGGPDDGHYSGLAAELRRALEQATGGKGAERHGGREPFASQVGPWLSREVGTAFPVGQAVKKLVEGQRMAARGDMDAARREWHGAIVYAAIACMAHHPE